MKNGEIVAEIRNSVRALNIDDRISARYILSILRDKAALYIKRENDLYRLFNYHDIWTTIDCLPMEESSNIECCSVSIPRCKYFMRSVDKLPPIFTYRNGAVIREVMSLDGSKIYLPTTPNGYKKILDREFKDKENGYYWFENGHIVIPDSRVKMIRFTAYFQDVSQTLTLGCNKSDSPKCVNPLEEEFQCPAHLRAIVKQEALNDILNSFKRVVVDEVPDLDNNNKTGKLE